jgi:beta-glucuronidase
MCNHEGGFTPFDCEVTTALKLGNNFVVIAVDSSCEVDDIPSVGIDWFNLVASRAMFSYYTAVKFIHDYDVH